MGQSKSKPGLPPRLAQWEWKSNSNPFSPSEEAQWTAYKPLDNYLLERAFFNNENEVNLGEYVVSIKEGLQKKKGDTFRQRPVRRNTEYVKNFKNEVVDLEQDKEIRSKRFFGVEKPRTFTKAFGNLSDYLIFFQNRNLQIKKFANLFGEIEVSKDINLLNQVILPCLSDCMESESKKFDQKEALKQEKYALFQEKVTNLDEFYAKVLKAYTMEGFLYKNLNKYLRNEDWTQLDCLLPYAYCLCKAFFHSELAIEKVSHQGNKLILYRGAQFDEAALSFYDQNTIKNFSWNSMTSTSRRREVAENFMYWNIDLGTKVPVMFIIEVLLEEEEKEAQSRNKMNWIDIKPFSAIPNEDEIVLAPGSVFEITKLSRDPKKGAEIYLRLMNNVDKLIHGGQVLHGAMQSEMAKDEQLKIVCLEGNELSEAIIHLTGNKLVEEVEFCLCKFNEKVLATLTEILKTVPNLKKLVFSSPASVDQTHFGDVLTQLETVRLEALEIYGKDAVLNQSQLSSIAKGIGCFPSLQSLTVDLSYCKEVTDEGLGNLCSQGIQNLKSLTYLNLQFHSCYLGEKGLENLSLQGIKNLTKLESLILNFEDCGITDEGIEKLCVNGIKQLILLKTLHLNFRHCNKLTDEALGILSSQGIKYLTSLKSLDLNFSWHFTLGDQALINFCRQGIPHLKRLQSLVLNFRECNKITDKGFSVLGSEGIKSLGSLEFLSLNFEWCRKLTDKGLNDLCHQGIKSLPLLKSLVMKFDECTKIRDEWKQDLQKLFGRRISFGPDNNKKLAIFERGKVIAKTTNENATTINANSFSTMEKLNSAIQNTSDRSLIVNFEKFEKITAQGLNDLWNKKIKNLASFTLAFKDCWEMTDEILKNFNFKENKHLKSFSLNFNWCSRITDQGLSTLWRQGISRLTSLSSLTINIRSCKITDKGLSDLSCEALKDLTSLTSLTLKFTHCEKITDEGLKVLSDQGIKRLTSLTSLSLQFEYCKEITDQGLESLWSKGIENLSSLTSLTLNFYACDKISNNGLKYFNCQKMKNLTALDLNFRSCSKITDEGIEILCSEGIQHLISLQSLTLNLDSCTSITDKGLSILCSEGIKHLTSLVSLSLNFHWCQRITAQGVNNLCSEGIKYLNFLTSLTLDFQQDYELTDEALNNLCWQGIKHLTSLTFLYLHFQGCSKVTDVAWKNFHKVLRYFGFQASQREIEDPFPNHT